MTRQGLKGTNIRKYSDLYIVSDSFKGVSRVNGLGIATGVLINPIPIWGAQALDADEGSPKPQTPKP